MTVTQIVFGSSLILILLTLAGYTGWKQWHVLRWANGDATLSPEDLKYFRRQASRRLISAILMIGLAGILISSFFFENRAQALADKALEARQRGDADQLNVEDLRFRDFYTTLWIGALILLFVLILLAGFDYLAIRRYGRRHYQIIQSERRAMIQDELKRYRREQSERN